MLAIVTPLRRHASRVGGLVALGGLLGGCLMSEYSDVEPRGGWRSEAERVCLLHRSASAYTEQVDPIVEKNICGIDHPFKVTALAGGTVAIDPDATLGCPLVDALDQWIQESVQPAAAAWIGAPVTEIRQLSSYACRKRNNVGAGFSEHAFGNALDIAEFAFANGRKVTLQGGWNGKPEEKSFLREIYSAACQRFTTTLGPGSNFLHYNHIHVDLAAVAPDGSARMCKPMPEGLAPIAAGPPGEPGKAGSTEVEVAVPGAD